MSRLFAAAVAALVLVACATADPPARPRGKITLVEADADPADLYVIDRARFDKALSRGPGWLMQQVPVRPVVVDGRFGGFQILSLFDGEGEHALKPGDIVQRVNGRSIERPDQFFEVWKTLPGAETLTVQIVRNRQPLLVTWTIASAKN
jgi:general secretion pathway protein C